LSSPSLVSLTCPACGVRIRSTLGWIRACGGAFCQGCTELIRLDAERFAASCEAIDDAMQVLDDAIGEMRKPLAGSMRDAA
jgi:hypothetical protein